MKKLLFSAVIVLSTTGLSTVVLAKNVKTTATSSITASRDRNETGSADLKDRNETGSADLKDRNETGSADLKDRNETGSADLILL